ncbi:MAG: AMP-binding protein, partial [Anaerolineaceae bacterium]|nr:AMP-binding protein [Anaerolineaceae bacterium]
MDKTIFQFIKTEAQNNPEAIAIDAPGRTPLTYNELHSFIKHATDKLNRSGIGRGDVIAIVLPNGPEMALAFLAIASTATAAPLNPAYRSSEYEFYLADLNIAAVLTLPGSSSPVIEAANKLKIPVILLSPDDNTPAGLFTLPDSRIREPVITGLAQPEDIALVLHTSGTTARPKIVPLTQKNLCTSAKNIADTLHLTASDRCLNVMPLFHIHGITACLLASLAAGSRVVCTPGFYAPNFFEWLSEFQPTWYSAVPTMHQAILARA